MPQMSPMYWMFLFMFFMVIYMMLVSWIYFFRIKKYKVRSFQICWLFFLLAKWEWDELKKTYKW